jgi:hypothetical protein
MCFSSAGTVLLALVLCPFASSPSALAVDSALVISGITTANEAGGLTPYVPLHTAVVVTFTDATPGDATAYRVKVAGIGTFKHAQPTGNADELAISVDGDQLPMDRERSYVVQEVQDDAVVDASAPVPFTLSAVGHPRSFSTSSEKVAGQWSYRAGDTAKFRFDGRWEKGTTFSTQVWVSRTKKFTEDDYTFNTEGGDLVTTSYASEPVMSVKIKRSLVGKYVWVSILGWKDGRAGWLWTVPAERVVRR